MDSDMIINKANWTTDKDSLRLSMPIGKVDVERRMVSGFASLDNIDKQDDIVTADASVKAFKNFKGNLREMHQPSAVGRMISFKEDRYFDPNSKKFYNGVYVSAYVSKGAQNAWEKVLDGTYTGFSIGGNIKVWDDAYNADLDKSIRIIKDYDLYELSLVDSPANQFASIISVEKVNGQNVLTGTSADTVIENVFYDSENGIVLVSDSETETSPVSGKNMENIGFVEKNDDEKANMIKFLVDSAKGISTIKITKEVNKMTEATEAVLDAVVENVEITPEAQPAEVETPAVVDEAPADTVVEKSDDGGAVPSALVVEEESVVAEVEAELAVAKSDESVADAIAEIKNSLTNAFGDLATTIKSLNEQVAALNKSVDDVSTEVTQVKGQFNEFGKRVDAVEQDTAFRKSGDLGEIVQFEPVKVQKSLWGGRFLKNSDLFN